VPGAARLLSGIADEEGGRGAEAQLFVTIAVGHHCRICGRERANERCSGKGHARHICRDCERLPRKVRFRIEARLEIDGFLWRQSCMSEKNLKRLNELAGCDDPEVSESASVVHDIGKVRPHRRRRLGSIRSGHPELWQRMVRAGIVEESPGGPGVTDLEPWLLDGQDEASQSPGFGDD
jgi:hypothetical protein